MMKIGFLTNRVLFYDLQDHQRTNVLGAELATRNIRTLESSAELSAILKKHKRHIRHVSDCHWTRCK